MSRISLIAAAAEDMVIGKDNTLPWNLPSDLKYFKTVTNGSMVIMGRKCWESIPEKFRPLPKRVNVVLTKNEEYVAVGAKLMHDFKTLIKELSEDGKDREVFVIGGSELYKEAFKYANKFYLTRIYSKIDGNVFLTGFIPDEWRLVETSELLTENGLDFNFQIYEKKSC